MFSRLDSSAKQLMERAPTLIMVVLVGSAAMLTYFSMYAFRKPFSAATYESVVGWGFLLDYKTALILAQVCGYALSKCIGIKVISEMTPAGRAYTLVLMIAIAEAALLLFAVLPAPWNVAALFLNGLPLGMVWGLVFSYLEGRRVSEALGVILSISLIFSSGAVKSVGAWLIVEHQVPDVWMPALTGAIFLPLLLVSLWLLQCVPPPSLRDMEERQQRITMDATQRWKFFLAYAPGIIALVLSYVILTGFREFTDNFAAEIWRALGYGDSPAIFASSTLPVMAIVLLSLMMLMFVRNNMRALQYNQVLVGLGFTLLALSTYLYQNQMIDGLTWMICMQTGLYMGFIPFNCLLFDRLVAATPLLANAGFLIYIADASGYAGSISILLYKTLAHPDLPWLAFVTKAAYLSGIVGLVLTGYSLLYFYLCVQRVSSPTVAQPIPASGS